MILDMIGATLYSETMVGELWKVRREARLSSPSFFSPILSHSLFLLILALYYSFPSGDFFMGHPLGTTMSTSVDKLQLDSRQIIVLLNIDFHQCKKRKLVFIFLLSYKNLRRRKCAWDVLDIQGKGAAL